MKKYLYKGGFAPACFAAKGGSVVRVILEEGNEYTLPEDNERIKKMVRTGVLTPVQEAKVNNKPVATEDKTK